MDNEQVKVEPIKVEFSRSEWAHAKRCLQSDDFINGLEPIIRRMGAPAFSRLENCEGNALYRAQGEVAMHKKILAIAKMILSSPNQATGDTENA